MAAPTASGNPVVLFVEDEPAISESVGALLHLRGFTTVYASTVAEAKRAVTERRIDAVILDLWLGQGGSGFDFVAWLRQRPAYVDTPVLVLTGHTSMKEDEEEWLRRERVYVFYKPKSVKDLADYLERLTRRGT